ncbi:MAG: hypothetical protein NC339_02500 [Muribaculaceae bacterium]|nr:hypothetical protein [Muribaculaceae bacterium]
MTNKTLRPRVEIVGSFLAPEELETSIAQCKAGQIAADDLHAVEDKVIDSLIDREIASGLEIVTDGEMRRKSWDRDFWEGLLGVERDRIDTGRIWQDEPVRQGLLKFEGRLAYNDEHPFFDKFTHLKQLADGRAEVRQTIPSPGELYMRMLMLGSGDLSKVYESPETLLDDIINAYRLTIDKLYALGCRHIQLDSSVWGRLCDTDFQRTLLLGGLNPDEITDTLVHLINSSIDGRPSDLEVTLSIAADETRIPRWGNADEQTHLRRMFHEINADAFLLPFDINLPEQLECLEEFPAQRRVILGLVDGSRSGLENVDDVVRAIRVAQRYVSPEWISISPTCGFKVKNRELQGLNYETQWAKIDLLNEAADMVGGFVEN